MAAIVTSVHSFATGMDRLCANNDGVVLFSRDKDFRIMIRNVPHDDECRALDVSILCGTPEIRKMCDMSYDGYFEDSDEDTYVIDEFTYCPKDPETLLPAMECINTLYQYRACMCGDQFIKDSRDMCVACEMTLNPNDKKKAACPICLDTGIMKHMQQMPCCKQFTHVLCWSKWQSMDPRCPLCRK